VELVKINYDKVKRNLLGEITIPECPWWHEVAENIMMMLDKMTQGGKIPLPFDYENMDNFQKRLMVEYWHFYDGLDSAFKHYENISQYVVFREWFMQSATPPERIRRSSQWLVEHQYLELKIRVRSHALETAGKARQTIGAHNVSKEKED